MILPIYIYGNLVLRKKCENIDTSFLNLDTIINNMFETMHNANGIGLAAPQIGLSINLFVGNWIANDGKTYMVSKFLIILSLIVTYFTGPVGLVLYWLVRIFYSKKINYYE